MGASKSNDEGVIVLTAPTGGVTFGDVKKIQGLVVMALNTLAAAATGTFLFRGLIRNATKVGSQAWTAGAVVYWDAGNSRFTTSATGNTKAGVAAADAGSGAGVVLGDVFLTGAI
jgi:predicted RecA/RadA family phage recombinase